MQTTTTNDTAGRFAGLDIDPEPATAQPSPADPSLAAPANSELVAELAAELEAVDETTSPPLARFAGLDIEGIDVPIHDAITDKTTFADYVAGSGPASLALREAGLHYPVVLEPLALASGRYCPNVGQFHGVIDTKTGRMLGRPVSKQYHLAQNATIAAMLDAARPDAEGVEVYGWNHGERAVFRVPLGAELEDAMSDVLKSEAESGGWRVRRWHERDTHAGQTDDRWFLIVRNAHGTLGKLAGCIEGRTRSCTNGLIMSSKTSGFAFQHSAHLQKRIEQMREAFKLAARDVVKQTELLAHLFATPLNATQYSEFMDHMFPLTARIKKSEKATASWQDTRDRYTEIYETAPGAAPGKLYGVVAADSYWRTHELPVDTTSAKQRDKWSDGLANDNEQTAELRAPSRRYELQLFGRSGRDTERALNWARVQL